jgi:hypothetical protein
MALTSKTLRRRSSVLIALVAASYGLVLLWFHLREDALLFHPAAGKLAAAPPILDLESRDVRLQSTDGTPLVHA